MTSVERQRYGPSCNLLANNVRDLAKVSLVGDGVIHVDQCWKFLGAEPFG